MLSGIDDLKKQVFSRMLELVGRVFILVRYSDDVVVGRRGFLPAEKEKGLVLVFNSKMNFTWDGSGISGRLVFGSTPEDCFIPSHSIVAVFSPELSAQFAVSPAEEAISDHGPVESGGEKSSSDSRVVRVDFKKNKK